MIHLKHITKSFADQCVLQAVDLEIQQGEHVMLTGISGCGKSTLLRIIAGLETPESGSVHLDNWKVVDGRNILVEAKDRSIGFVPQDLGLWDNLSAKKNILMGRTVDKSLLNSLMETAGLTSIEKRPTGYLSAGERQRVALLRALVSAPKILLLDEPFASLDLLRRQDFHATVRQLVSNDCTAITVTHDLTDWYGLEPHRLLVLEDGIIQDDILRGGASEIYNSRLLNAWHNLDRKL